MVEMQLTRMKTGRYPDLDALKAKLQDRTATAAVIGLGYVGLPLALEIASSGFKVIGIDSEPKKITLLKIRQILHPRRR
jgi:UDP-N-acetyl-D-glucosamine dehydrogenase